MKPGGGWGGCVYHCIVPYCIVGIASMNGRLESLKTGNKIQYMDASVTFKVRAHHYSKRLLSISLTTGRVPQDSQTLPTVCLYLTAVYQYCQQHKYF